MYKGISLQIDEASEEKIEAYERESKERYLLECSEKYRNSGVPAKFYKSSFDTFQTRTSEEEYVKKVAIDFAENTKNKVLIMCGNNGNGKTHLGTSILYKSIIDGNGGLYVTSPNLCVGYESAIGYKAKMSREELLEYHSKACGVTVIDECCKYFLNPDLEKFLLGQIVCSRYENDLATVLISNASKEDLVNFLGKAVYDRLTEVCTTIDFSMESKRKYNRG